MKKYFVKALSEQNENIRHTAAGRSETLATGNGFLEAGSNRNGYGSRGGKDQGI